MKNISFQPVAARSVEMDSVAGVLFAIARNTLVVTLGLFPLFFVPGVFASVGFSKIMFVLVGTAIAVVVFALAVLRDGRIRFSASPALMLLWVLAGVYVIASLASGDIRDSFIGDAIGVQTAAFMVLFAVVATVSATILNTKQAVARLFTLLVASCIVLGMYHLARFGFGPEFLNFTVEPGRTGRFFSPFGSWNGLGVFGGLVLLICFVASQMLRLTRFGVVIISLSVISALALLSLVNFFAIWVVLALASFIILMYSLVYGRLFKTEQLFPAEKEGNAKLTILLAGIVLVSSCTFLFAGTAVSSYISSGIGGSYIEVRPSHTATIEIMKHVYNEQSMFGIGPNKFVDAWRLYKNPAINNTIFWASSFDGGSDLFLTSFVTTGIAGIVAWVLFLAFFIWQGVRMLVSGAFPDRFWAFIGVASFVAAVYLWLMTALYMPTTTIMLLAAVCTGLCLGAYRYAVPQQQFEFSFLTSRMMGVALIGMTVFVIVGSLGAVYFVGQQYVAVYSFLKATKGPDAYRDGIERTQERIALAFERSTNDVFAREVARARLLQLQGLMGQAGTELDDSERTEFQTVVAHGLNAGQQAVDLDPTEPLNYGILGQFYSLLTLAGVNGAYDRAKQSYETAKLYDPKNPSLPLLTAQLESRRNELGAARELAEQAVAMKRNYTDALFFLSQLDIVEGNVQSAIQMTEAVVSFEPQNPARHYQLGILYASTGNLGSAIASFERAVALDTQYANARYFLALAYAEQGRIEEALAQMRAVESLNPDNALVDDVIGRLERGEPIANLTSSLTSAEETVVEDGQEVTAEALDETSLVAPVNTVPDNDGAADNTTSETTGETE
ncbi:MAG: tetratricopeptide repeat protein [Candidatus Paceibacterota bacterium]